MPPLEVVTATATTTTKSAARGRYGNGNTIISRAPPIVVVQPPLKPSPTVTSTSALIIKSSSPAATARHQSCSSNSSSSSSLSTSGGSSPSSVTTVTTIESHSSTGQAPTRDLIGEYLAAKSRVQPPAIFSPQVTPTREVAEQLELAYKHPILLMDEEENVYCSVVSSVGNERNREVEVKYIEDNSIELLDAKDEFNEGEKESLIVPKPKMIAFHSLKASGDDSSDGKCRLVGKVNPNILKTWEQLSGGQCEHKQRKNSRNSLITVTSSENSGDKQSCLIFYRNQYNVADEVGDFKVTRIRHGSISTSSTTTIADEEGGDERTATMTTGTTTTVSMVTSTTTTETTSSEGCYDFYDSIDNGSSRIGEDDELDDEEDEYALAGGEGLADFTSLDRKKLMWSIDVE